MQQDTLEDTPLEESSKPKPIIELGSPDKGASVNESELAAVSEKDVKKSLIVKLSLAPHLLTVFPYEARKTQKGTS